MIYFDHAATSFPKSRGVSVAMQKALKECGFELVNCFDDISDNKPCETTQRILYVAKPIKE